MPYLHTYMCTSMAYVMVRVLCTNAALKRNTPQPQTGGPTSPGIPQPNTGTSGGSQNDNIFAGTGGLSSSAAQGGKKKRKKITKADISGPSNFV